MHIPDGYLGPPTYGILWAAMAAIWLAAGRKIKQTLMPSETPFLALAGAFSFVIMMFNVPMPGGVTGHATASTLIAILIGPWLAVIAVSTALVMQAVLFGDGGITALGANCFNIAFIGSIGGYIIYKIIAKGSSVSIKRRLIAAGIASYLGINLSAFFTAFELGIQPLLHISPDGRPLYSPFPLSITMPAIMLEHLTLFGLVEAAVTVMVISYIWNAYPELLRRRIG